ncbi:MAG TPA: serine/threonine-protein kinase, partial [Planctomycetota bacterium]|nr:serine/threonine-protein kinase [Planctomycetota bacterium]
MKVLCPRCGASVEAHEATATCAACGATFPAGEAKTSVEGPPPPDPLLGTVVGGCKLLERIGAGGMGVVYKAEQLSLGRTVAVKLLPEPLRRDSQIEDRFRREIAILARLSHPNIVGILDGGVSEHGAYFVMEHVEGVSLRRVLAQGGVSPQEALRIIPQVCDALEYAHERGVVHRDIKP